MVLEQNIFNKKEFFELFQKRFFSFSEKCPLFLRFTILDTEVLVYDLSRNPENKPISFPFDFTVSEKVNIRKIKDYLIENCYPTFTIYDDKSRAPTSLEIQEMMFKKGMPFKEASSVRISDSKDQTYRIEKVFNSTNSVIARCISGDNEAAIYELKIPVTIFIRELFLNEVNASEIFKNKSVLVKHVYDKNEE